MEGLVITRGYKRFDVSKDTDSLNANLGDEVAASTIQEMVKSSTVWLSAVPDEEVKETWFILSGKIQLEIEDENVVLHEGDSFTAQKLPHDVTIKVIEDAKLLYTINKAIDDDVETYQANLKKLMLDINKKDMYTYNHSVNVMNYSGKLLMRLVPDTTSYDDMMTAALFHDVGKCMIPDEVLGKQGVLTDKEKLQMIKHPQYSARLLQPSFGVKIASIAREHHERLDGSGYPFGLYAEDISIESRIIAVADSFDAMTTKRCYRPSTKTFLQAAAELKEMTNLYDKDVVNALWDLVNEGIINESMQEKKE